MNKKDLEKVINSLEEVNEVLLENEELNNLVAQIGLFKESINDGVADLKQELNNKVFTKLKKIADHNEEFFDKHGYFPYHEEVVSLDYQGQICVTDPFMDETDRKNVNPLAYYGQKNIKAFIKEAKEKGIV